MTTSGVARLIKNETMKSKTDTNKELGKKLIVSKSTKNSKKK